MREASGGSERLRIVASGGLEIWCGRERVDQRIPAKAALLVAYLADRGTAVSRGTLAGLLWSDHAEEQARTSLRVTLTRARRHIPHLQADRSTLTLAGDVSLDLHEMERDGPDAVMSLRRGEAFAGLEVDGADLFDQWLAVRREEHRVVSLRALADGASDAETGGRWDEVLDLGRRMTEIEPWNEVAHRHVIRSLAATEGRSSALAAFDRCASVLEDEFGVPPETETVRLCESIRRGDVDSGGRAAGARPGADRRQRSVAWRLLGQVQVTIDGVPCDVGGRHRRSVMAMLALRAPNRCTTDELIAAVWGEGPPVTAEQSIRRHVRELQGLAPEIAERIEGVPDGYRLSVRPTEVDAIDVRSVIAGAQSELRLGELDRAAAALRDAIGSWDGASLGGVTRNGQLAAARASLEELRLGAIEDLVEAELALGRHREISSEAEAFASDHPTRERAWANLMLARSRTGRRAEAIDAFRSFEAALVAEGLEPSRSIVALHRQILGEAPAVEQPAELGLPTDSWRLPVTTFSVPLPPAFDRSMSLPLAGRRRELQALVDALEEEGAGPTSLFVGGEPGIGKTRLAAELARAAADAGAVVLYGRCDQSLGLPFQAWREALGHLADHVPPHVARRHLDRFGPALHLLMPTLVHNTSDADHNQGSDPHHQDLLFRATTELLADVARRRRLVLVIDDMQWAHPTTLELVRHVARQMPEPAMLLGLYRTTDVPGAHPLNDLIAELSQARQAHVIELGGLDAAAREELVRSALPDGDDEQVALVASKIATEAGGNPFFLTEVLRSLRDSGPIGEVVGPDSRLSVPPTVQRVVAQRVAKLGDAVSGTLRVASVFGREFDLDVLARVLGRNEDDLLDEVETAIGAGLVGDAPLGRDRFAFAHDLIHHTLVAELSRSRRSRLHRSIASSIEAIHGPVLGDHLPVVASHLLAADGASPQPHTLRRCHEAGRHAAAQHAAPEALAWFERVVEATPTDDPTLPLLLVELGTQQRNVADPEHCATLIEAGRLALERGDVDTLVAATLVNSRGMNAHVWDLDDARIEMLRTTLAALGPVESAERADLLASLANEQWDDAHRRESESFYREAMRIARDAGDPETLARVLVRVSRARNFRLDRIEMAAVSGELRELVDAVELSDPLLFANCLTTVLNTSIRLGLADETKAAIEAIRVAADTLPLPMFTLPAHLARCLDAGLHGDIEAYEQASTDTYHHATLIGDEEAGFIFEGQLFYTAYLRGDLAPILQLSIDVMNERPEVPLYRAVCTLIHVEAGEHDAARAMLDAEATTGIEPTVDMFGVQALVAWADAAASLGHAGACRQLYTALVPLTTEMSGHLVQVGEPIDISLGRLASVLGDFAGAAEHFDIAERIAEAYEADWMRLVAAISRAEMLLLRGGVGDVSTARVIADDVLPGARRFDYRGIAQRAERVLDHEVEASTLTA